jgi:hypothetical protein
MQQLLSRLFLVIYLFVALVPGRVIEELDKMPQLMAHYQVHQNIDPSTTWLSFLGQHYGAGFAKHQSQHNHDNLPGKDHHTHFACACQMVWGLPEHSDPLIVFLPVTDVLSAETFCAAELPPSQFLSGIWQPPKA